MAQESNSARRCGQIGDGEDDELSMVDVLHEQARLHADANAVLGGSDANNCTYPQGYLKRQALYACATCTPDGNAGICLACSYACHEGHDLYELYTKRFFTCDCGNEKFGGQECKLYKDKKELNARNHYNQNFKGVYCICGRPYPDPEDTVEDEMIQCIMCEDWHHGRHLKTKVPDSDNFQEMTCPGCMSRFPFLWAYNVTSPAMSVKPENAEDTATVDVTTNSEIDKAKSMGGGNGLGTSQLRENGDSQPEPLHCESSEVNGSSTLSQNHADQLSTSVSSNVKREHTENSSETSAEEPVSKRLKLENEQTEEEPTENNNGTKQDINEGETEQCILESLQKCEVECPDCAAFWPDGWRSKLCQCPNCLEMYKDRKIEFLIDEQDTVHAYEEEGRNSVSGASEEESEATALAGMNRVQQIEVVRGFMDLKTELNEFLQGFAREGKVVTETDIREFFLHMNQRRRRDRVHIPQHNCR